MEYFETARINMVKNQLMPNAVKNEKILDAFLNIPKHEFFENKWSDVCYSDAELPIYEGRIMLANDVSAKMIEAIATCFSGVVLEIGTGNGYITAILARLFKKVISVEADLNLATVAANRLIFMNINNISLKTSEFISGAPESGPYNAIILNLPFQERPKNLLSQLSKDGILIGIKRFGKHLYKVVMYKEKNNRYDEFELFQTACSSKLFIS
jgi:protein-L-isoaspartate(D-aspartate) O-methyltransferase